MRITPFMLAVLIAALFLPFLVQLVKVKTQISGGLAFVVTCVITLVVAVAIVAYFSVVGLLSVGVTALVIFIAAHAIYEPIVQRFFPGKGSL